MEIKNVEIHTGSVEKPYKVIGTVTAKRSAATLFSPAPTIEEVNGELQQQAAGMYANAVIDVTYDRGMSLTSYKVLKATGTAIVRESQDVACPRCAEQIKRAAKVCRFCNYELSVGGLPPSQLR